MQVEQDCQVSSSCQDQGLMALSVADGVAQQSSPAGTPKGEHCIHSQTCSCINHHQPPNLALAGSLLHLGRPHSSLWLCTYSTALCMHSLVDTCLAACKQHVGQCCVALQQHQAEPWYTFRIFCTDVLTFAHVLITQCAIGAGDVAFNAPAATASADSPSGPTVTVVAAAESSAACTAAAEACIAQTSAGAIAASPAAAGSSVSLVPASAAAGHGAVAALPLFSGALKRTASAIAQEVHVLCYRYLLL